MKFKLEDYIITTIFLLVLLGWVLNFQNLWEYWPETGRVADVQLRWIISLIGILVAPSGSITGWIW